MTRAITSYYPRTNMTSYRPYNTRSSRKGLFRSQMNRMQQFINGGSYTATKTRKRRMTSGQGVTEQYDRRRIYRKRRAPRRFRRRWKGFIRKVQAVNLKSLGSRTIVFNNLIGVDLIMSVSNSSYQNWGYCTLYGNRNGTAGSTHNDDINTILADTSIGTTGKIQFGSGVLDITCRNSSVNDEQTLNPSIVMEVDVYELSFGNLFDIETNLNTKLAAAQTDTAVIPGQTNSLVITRRGATPWDFPSFLSETKAKIWKKTKYLLSPNQTFTYQMRDPRNHWVDRQYTTGTQSENLPGLTKYVMFICKPTTGYTYDDTYTDLMQLSIGVTRKYLYKINEEDQDFDAYMLT